MAAIQDLNSISSVNGSDIWIIDDGTETQTATVNQLVTYLGANLSIPTGIDDITGLQTALDGKASVDHTHIISQVAGLRDELDTKYDSTTAGILGTTVIIGANSININDVVSEAVADITGVSPTDSRIPGNVTIGNRLVFTSTNGQIGEETPQQFKADLQLNNVDNTTDVDKPVSNATQDALDLKLNIDAFTEGQAAQDALIASNTAKNGITDDQAAAIVANTAKTSYPTFAATKLATIESGADVTDTTNVWSSLGISTGGRTTFVLSERGVFVPLPDSGGNVGQLISSVSTNQTAISSGGGIAQFTITGEPATIVNLSIVNSNPANWIANTALNTGQIALNSNGIGVVTVTVPEYTLTETTRSFQLQAQVEGEFQAAVTSEVVTQYTSTNLLTSVTLSVVNFGNAGVVENINVVGVANTQFNVELFQVTPAGWIATGALSATSGVLDGNGLNSSITVTIPTAQDDSVNRSFRIRVRATSDLAQLAESPVITQVHTQSTQAGNLIAGADAVYSTPVIDFFTHITQGEAPYEIVLNNHPTDKTVNPIHTITLSDPLQSVDLGNNPDFPYTNDATGNSFRWFFLANEDGVSFLGDSASGEFIYNSIFAGDATDDSFITDAVVVRLNGFPVNAQFLHNNNGGSIQGILSFPTESISGWTGFDEIADFGTFTGYYGNSTGVLTVERTADFQINVGGGEFSFTTDDTGNLNNSTNHWQLFSRTITIGNPSYFPPAGHQVTVSFGGHSETILTESVDGVVNVTLSDTDLIAAIQASGTDIGAGTYQGTSAISFVVNPGILAAPPDGITNYYVHISDADEDIVVAMESINIDNQVPTGNISQTMGSPRPSDGHAIEFTASFMDAESNPFNYQWQYNEPSKTFVDFDDLPTTFAGDVTPDNSGSSVSTWGGSTTLSEALGFTVTTNSLQGFEVRAGFSGAVSLITSNTTDSISVASEGGAITNLLSWSGARLYDNTYVDPTGETGSILGFTWGSSDVSQAVDKSTLSTSTNTGWGQAGAIAILRDVDPQDAGGTANDRIFWGASATLNTGSVIAFWEDGQDHRFVDPFLTLGDNASSTSSNYGGNAVWQHTSLTTAELEAIKAISVNETTSGTSNYYTIPEANWESWEGTQTVPETEYVGLYRCQVTAVQGDTTPVNSNSIELT